MEEAVGFGIDAGSYPGAVVVIGTSDTVLWSQGYGHLSWSANSEVPDPGRTLYDLASLTKVLATTTSVMLLVDRNRIELGDPVVEYLPAFGGEGKGEVTVQDLLTHQSGLRAFLPLNESASSAAEARSQVLEEPVRWRPRSRVEYSDLNAMILGWVVEARTGESLDRFAAREIFGPLGMEDTGYRISATDRTRAAPVGVWRGHDIRGEVHDQNAVRLGGVSGHAGLYSTGRDLSRFARFWLRKGRSPDGFNLVGDSTIELFSRPVRQGRALGWEVRDTSSTDNSGRLMSPGAIGHTGFTGTSIWIDPELDLFVILLTNRVYRPRTNRSITVLKEVRGRVADAAVQLLRQTCSNEGRISACARR